ncbi:MAG: glycosyltransferase family 9 protein [Chloroflexales bacterium]|nr:glycosyltransferase family 9 protein [Chloroflexales bacterium]
MNSLLRRCFLYALAFLARLFARRHSAHPPARVLVIKPDHLGDVLLATPALSALRQVLPDSHITALVGPWARAALAANPHIDTLQMLPFPGFERQPSGARYALSIIQPYITLLRYALILRHAHYDTAIVLRDDHWWGAALALLAGIPRRIGYAVPECRPFLTDVLPWDRDEHVTVQGLRLVARLIDIKKDDRTASSFILHPSSFIPSASDAAWADAWLRSNEIAERRLVVIHPGTGGQSKLWLSERWAALGDKLIDISGCHVVVTGGPGEADLVAAVAGAMRDGATTLVGATTVGQLAALLARATLVLGVDSGPLHLAAAVGAPSLHLYGPGDDRRFGPWGDPQRHVVLRSGLWCSPCGVFSACPRSTRPSECMERITTRAVLAAAQQLLAAV